MLSSIKSLETPLDKMCHERVTLDGAWLTVVSDIINRTTLSADEFQEKLPLSFRMDLIGICNRCGSCRENLAVDHALQLPHLLQIPIRSILKLRRSFS